MKNYGQRTLGFNLEANRDIVSGHAEFQVTDVKSPILSVPQLCTKGFNVLFHDTGGTLKHRKTGKEVKFERYGTGISCRPR